MEGDMDDVKSTDRIHIRDLVVRCIIGVNDWERKKRQDVSLSVTLHADLRRAGESDKLEDTVDYKRLKNRIVDLVENSRFHLIEKVAQAVADVCLDMEAVRRVDVTVDKPGALRFARSVAVEISRTKDEA
jgi:FolB domain-containing protein